MGVLKQQKTKSDHMEKRLVTIRMRQKRKKREFIRQEYHKHKKKLGRKWRQPMGRTSKLRMKEKARGKQPSMGFGSPAELRGMSKFGQRIVRISNVDQLSGITDNKTMIAEITSGVGMKKKLEIVNAAKSKGIIIFNLPKKSLEKKKKVISEKKNEKKESKPKAEPKKE